MATSPKPATARAVNVQVPGEQAEIQTNELQAEQLTEYSPECSEAATNEIQSEPVDMDALRAQIRAEEQAKARSELGEQIRAAQDALEAGTPQRGLNAPGHRSAYRHTPAAEIDPASLTAPVLTKDGWLCPPAPTE